MIKQIKMMKKRIKQFAMAVKRPAQAFNIVESEVKMRLGFPTLRSVEFQVLHQCNLKCDFCYASDIMYASDRKKNPISVDKFRQIMQECHELGMIHVNITGGEPLLRKDVFELIEAVPKSVIVSLVTNNSLLTKDIVDKLISSGLSTIQMSYGSCYSDYNRELAQYCVANGLSVTLSIVNIASERENNEKAIEMAREDGLNVLFNYPMRYNNKGLDSDFYWKYRYESIVREDNLFWSGKDVCPAGTHKIYITNDGDVTSCDRIHHNEGNVYDEPVKDIWSRMYKKYKTLKSFCLLETEEQQWRLNNELSNNSYLFNKNISNNPFDVLEKNFPK